MNPPSTPIGRKELRRFALTLGGMVALVFGLLLPWTLGLAWPRWPWIVLLVLALWAGLHPGSLRPVHSAWMRFGAVLGTINNALILGFLYLTLITAFGLARRTLGRDPLARRPDSRLTTYRKPKSRRTRESFERPY